MDIVDLAKEISKLNSCGVIKASLVSDVHRCVYNGVVINNYYTKKELNPVSPWAIHTLDVPALAELCVWANEQPTNNQDDYLTTCRTVSFQVRQAVTEAVVDDLVKHRFFVEWERHRNLQRGTAKQIMTGKQFPTVEWLLTAFSSAQSQVFIRVDDHTHVVRNKHQLNRALADIIAQYTNDALFAKYPDAAKLMDGRLAESGLETVFVATLLTLFGHNVEVSVGIIQ